MHQADMISYMVGLLGVSKCTSFHGTRRHKTLVNILAIR